MASATFAPPTLPGPRPLPVLGLSGNFIRFLRDPIRYMQANYERYGPISAVSENDLRQIMAVGPEYNRLLLSDATRFQTVFDAVTPERMKRRRPGIGLLQMNGAQHKQQRRLMMPAFHRKQVESYREVMIAYAQDVLDRWRPGATLNIAHQMQQLTLRVATRTLFGLDSSEQAEGMGLLIKRVVDTSFFAPQVILFPYDLPGTPFRRAARYGDQLDAALLEIIRHKRANPAAQHDVLATLIHARDEEGGSMTDNELLGQAVTLLIAGHETTANTLVWTLLLLAQHPQVAADLVDELTSTLRGTPPTIEQLRPDSGQLPLLERVIKESMRLIPTAPLGSRVSTEPFQLGPYHLPPGTFVSFSQHLTHRLPELYPAPLKFRPARWETLDPSPYEYIPFGAGPRMCIGATFALMEMKIVLAMLLQRYRLTLAPNARVDWHMGLTLAPKGALPMTVAEQDHRFRAAPVRGTIHELVDLRGAA